MGGHPDGQSSGSVTQQVAQTVVSGSSGPDLQEERRGLGLCSDANGGEPEQLRGRDRAGLLDGRLDRSRESTFGDRQHDVLLGLEVVIDRAGAGLGGRDDVRYRHGADPTFTDQHLGGVEDRLATRSVRPGHKQSPYPWPEVADGRPSGPFWSRRRH